jgi:hypothetical protein
MNKPRLTTVIRPHFVIVTTVIAGKLLVGYLLR